jgi:ribosome-binding ATPase YchF (GTP1/OBG family)
LTRLSYQALDLISFFTVGADEVRAWPIPRGSDALTAAGRIHTDLARGFIRAEVVPYAAVAGARDPRDYKAHAHAELMGKEYVVQDGDILNIRFSV